MSAVSHDSETPAHGQQVITACAFIHHDFDGVNKIFLAKRADTKKFMPGIYELLGGHIDFDENVVDGLAREVMEETGMNISIGDVFWEFTYSNWVKGSHSIEVVYFAKFTDALEQIKLHPDDHSDYKWVASHEVVDVMKIGRDDGDSEIQAVKRGFELLAGGALNFG
ncbi:MAG TPA: NUDIX hydrolase [Candidatus Binatia bacterium]|nr:NUDIX hydrolase [Candidatus Binatia bacterium]